MLLSWETVEFLPGIGLDRVRFGESRTEHRSRLGDFKPFERTPGTGVTDMYPEFTLMLSYDEADRLKFIELAGEAVVTFNGIQISDRSLQLVFDDLNRGGFEIEFDGDACFTIIGTGIEIFTSNPDDLTEPAEGLSLSA